MSEKIFAMKYKMEIPILNLRNTFPEDGKPYQSYESTLYQSLPKKYGHAGNPP